jgi:hypothetical protein
MNDVTPLVRRHLRFGWYALACFSLLGIGLELLHAFKLGFYLDVDSETRRLMWRLAHAHGTLLAVVNLAFACCLPHASVAPGAAVRLRRASACLLVAGVLLPAGFFLGGVFASSADPSPLVALVPAGAVLLIAAAWTMARSVR